MLDKIADLLKPARINVGVLTGHCRHKKVFFEGFSRLRSLQLGEVKPQADTYLSRIWSLLGRSGNLRQNITL